MARVLNYVLSLQEGFQFGSEAKPTSFSAWNHQEAIAWVAEGFGIEGEMTTEIFRAHGGKELRCGQEVIFPK